MAVGFVNGVGVGHDDTLTVTPGAGSDRLMVFMITWESNGGGGVGDAASVAFGSAALNFEGKIENPISGTLGGVEIWTLNEAGIAGEASTADIVITWNNQPQGGETALLVGIFDGVDQTTPKHDVDFDSSQNTITASGTTTSVTDGMIAYCYQHGSPGTNWSDQGGGTEIDDIANSSMRGGAAYIFEGTAWDTDCVGGATNRSCQSGAFSMAPAAGGATRDTQIGLSFRCLDGRDMQIGLSFRGQNTRNTQLGLSFRGAEQRNTRLGLSFHGLHARNTQLGLSFRGQNIRDIQLGLSFDAANSRTTQLSVSFHGATTRATQLGLSFHGASTRATQIGLSFQGVIVGENRNTQLGISFSGASAVIQRVGNWESGLTYNVENGDNRLLIFGLGYEHDDDTGINTVTYGGQSMTRGVAEVAGFAEGSVVDRTELWYLDETGITSSASSVFIVGWGSGVPDKVAFAAATYINVNQNTPIRDSSRAFTNSPPVNPITTTVSAIDGGYSIGSVICNNEGNYTWNNSWVEGKDTALT